MKKITRYLTLIIILGILAGCTAAPTPQPTKSPNLPGTSAWIDGPRDGVTIPLEPYEVIFHVADAGGVAAGELKINGELAAMIPSTDSAGSLATLRFMWNPPTPGEYLLEVRGQSASGAWSGVSSARVTVGEPTPTFTPTHFTDTPSITPTVTNTGTSTPTPTSTSTPTPTATSTFALLEFTASASTGQIYSGNCGTTSVVVSAQLNHTENVKHVELYVRLQDNQGSGGTNWDSYSVMKDLGGGQFQTTVKGPKIPGADKYISAVVLYQVIAVGYNGKPVGRSETFSDVTLLKCLTPEIISPDFQFITTTPTYIKVY